MDFVYLMLYCLLDLSSLSMIIVVEAFKTSVDKKH